MYTHRVVSIYHYNKIQDAIERLQILKNNRWAIDLISK